VVSEPLLQLLAAWPDEDEPEEPELHAASPVDSAVAAKTSENQ
jgi:hypothetical protein